MMHAGLKDLAFLWFAASCFEVSKGRKSRNGTE